MKDENLYNEDELYENDFDEDDVIDNEKEEEKPHIKKETNFIKEDNFDKKTGNNNSNKKEVYSLNLTEGRVVFIFATFIIIVFTGIFSTIFIMSHISKKKITVTTNNKATTNLNKEENQKNQAMEFNFYSELVKKNLSNNDKKLSEVIDKRKENNGIVSENVKEKIKESAIVKRENVINSATENIALDDIVTLDDSEVIYASTNIGGNKLNVIETTELRNNSPYRQTKKEVFVKKGTTTPIKSETSNVNNVITTPSSINSPLKNETITPKQSNKVVSNNTTNNIKNVSYDTTRYVVQIGSFSSENKAKELEKVYKLDGYPTYIKIANIDGKDYYRLRVGPFKDKNRANEYLNAIKNSKYGKDSYLSKVVGVM